MKQKGLKKNSTFSENRFFIVLLSIYFVLLLIISSLACFFSYKQKYESLMAQLNNTFVQLKQEYRMIADNFWQVYMPIFEPGSNMHKVISLYYNSSTPLNPLEKRDLSTAANQLLLRDNDIQWLVLFNPDRKTNYILYAGDSTLHTLPEDFPYYKELCSSSQKMNVYEMKPIKSKNSVYYTFAVCGGTATTMAPGNIMVGYSTAKFESICSNQEIDIKSLIFLLTNNGDILFDSSGTYASETIYRPETPATQTITSDSGKLYVCSETCGLKTSLISYYASFWEIFRYCHVYTPLILLIVLLFAVISVVGYMIVLHMVRKEVSIIRDGLEIISENHLDYQIPAHFQQSGLVEIAHSINRMALRLKENINLAYYYKLRQKESELAELQSKFNPHFLYNTLEMLRSRCYQNGDVATAKLIAQLAYIFRGLIGSKAFIPITEELTFNKRYLALFNARYGDMVKINYAFDTEILKYGIIQNVLQPLTENYFVHGFDTSNTENYILFKGKSLDDGRMILIVEDNGSGMTAEEITHLNEKLHEPITMSSESYGLKNLHQRLQLFYGENCGLTIYPNPNGGKGLSIQIIAKKMTCEDYEKDKKRELQ